MDSLRSVLPKVLAKRGLKGHATAALVTHKAQQFFNRTLPNLADTIRVWKFEQGTLFISVGHSIAAQECQGLKGQLLEYLGKECSEQRVSDVSIIRSK